jgi:hypothetical protein
LGDCRLGGCRALAIALLIITVSGEAQAQFPYNYAPYTPRYPPNTAYAPPTEDRSPASMAHEMLDAHNTIRVRVGVPPLVWSDQLAQVAQDWVNHLIATGALSHRPTIAMARTYTQYPAGTRRRPRLSISGPRKHRDTTFAAIPAPACAGTIRRSSGQRPVPSAAPWPEIHSVRSGSATTILQETSSGSDRTEQPR